MTRISQMAAARAPLQELGAAAEERLAHKFARELASMHGLKRCRPDDCLAPWMRDARLAAAYFTAYYGQIIERYEDDICRLRELLSNALAAAGGHASDCAVHNAPAYDPEPCDCGASEASHD